MDGTVMAAVLTAALLHAAWNAAVKGSGDKLGAMAAVVVGHTPLALIAILASPLPDAASIRYLLGGILLHFGYQLFLQHSYRSGDLTQVYPIARGSAPLIVAGISIAFLGVTLGTAEIVAILLIGLGILSLSLVRRSDGLGDWKAGAFALVTSGFIAAYTLVDGYGARLAATSFGFYDWLALGNALCMLAYIAMHSPRTLPALVDEHRGSLIFGGGASFAAYALVTWAFTQAPIALVAALRETSIVFAMLIGVVYLKERIDLPRIFATMLTLFGALLLKYTILGFANEDPGLL